MTYIKEEHTEEELKAIKKEKIRINIVKLIYLTYFLLIFEGALRKWVFPSISYQRKKSLNLFLNIKVTTKTFKYNHYIVTI